MAHGPEVQDVQSANNVITGQALGKNNLPSRISFPLPHALLIACVSLSAPCAAAPLNGHALLEDTKLYFTAPVRWDGNDWLYFGGTIVAIGVAYQFDDNVRAHFATSSSAALDGSDPNSLRDAAPAAAMLVGTWAFAAILDDRDGYEEGGEMLEAAGLTALSTTLLKFAAGRMRPNETTQVDDWFQGGDSFPSMHVSATFAIGTVLAESGGDEYRWLRRALGYGLASATAYARIHDNVHWLSDTVAGAALGIATAHFTMHRGDARAHRSAFMVVPANGGLLLTYTHPLH
jgi:membrane-associated phospholipid phosphatase